ncbi:hypothetical protein [Frankia sp. AgW1.1]|uniref:hypothetical protein n=1 Tax=Frankia sp. AgW1.1 TaxID=1836971 RepID=UPI001933D9B0|nr:hypothetical protein [Frankia sp. AgW1.1]MBL7487163.1 hypothetical protein [Frankia sp. AgW1.1]
MRASDRPDYTEAIDRAGAVVGELIGDAIDPATWALVSEADAADVSALAHVSIAMSLVTLTRQIADFGPALASELLDGIASSVQSIDTQIGGSV